MPCPVLSSITALLCYQAVPGEFAVWPLAGAEGERLPRQMTAGRQGVAAEAGEELTRSPAPEPRGVAAATRKPFFCSRILSSRSLEKSDCRRRTCIAYRKYRNAVAPNVSRKHLPAERVQTAFPGPALP